ncbi:MAG: hypothetical protein IT212_07040 [Bacteroidia bacterium]|nr:hypothetical protein [Bacteroidia bacterium]
MADYRLLIPKIKKYEGGLSKAKTDSASKYPVPDGSGYHTNKGITWQTFKNSATKIGYTATPSLFYEMPDQIWTAILKNLYWDAIQGDKINSQAVAEMLADAIWAGAYNAKYAVKAIQILLNKNGFNLTVDGIVGPNTVNAINKFATGNNEKLVLDAAYTGRKLHFEKLGGPNLQGWLNRLNSLYGSVQEYLKKIVSAASEVIKKKTLKLFLQ